MKDKKKDKPKPVYLDRLPPCNNACPLGNNIQKWLQLAKKSNFKEAWETIMVNNPLPSTIGRVCYHPCEDSCNRFGFDAAININAVERFLGDMALEAGWKIAVATEKSGKKVLVIGAGPAGLSAAYQLTLQGHEVTIYDANPQGGGTMHLGIPAYRLPRHILDAEVKRIEDMGVTIEYNRHVTDLVAEKNRGGFDAVLVAIGATVGRIVDIPTTAAKVEFFEALNFLAAIEYKKPLQIAAKHVVVYGGGNTAIDAARCAVRLGAAKVEIVYRRNREKMPAHDFEVAEALGENIELRLLRTIQQINGNDLTLEVMELNEEGWPCPTGVTETIPADVVILALGLNVDTDFLRSLQQLEFRKDSSIIVDEHFRLALAGVYAGGDVTTYERNVATAIGHGKKAASNIDSYLRGETYFKEPKHELAGHDNLHVDYYQKSDRKQRSQIGFPQAQTSFAEVVNGLTEDEAIHEASRCFSCGNCFECDTCYNVCPVKAITKLAPGKRYKIDYDTCIRCGMCARKCPCGAIKMVSAEKSNNED